MIDACSTKVGEGFIGTVGEYWDGVSIGPAGKKVLQPHLIVCASNTMFTFQLGQRGRRYCNKSNAPAIYGYIQVSIGPAGERYCNYCTSFQ
jgi:hypothetical protein